MVKDSFMQRYRVDESYFEIIEVSTVQRSRGGPP
jgi:hypothetical protein